jgi:hypothetical protein
MDLNRPEDRPNRDLESEKKPVKDSQTDQQKQKQEGLKHGEKDRERKKGVAPILWD